MDELFDGPCYRLMGPGLEDRCLKPMDDEIHDPLGPVGRHVFSPYPPCKEDLIKVGSKVWVHFECGTSSVTGIVRSIEGDYAIVDHVSIELLPADGGGWCCQVGRDLDQLDLVEDVDWPSPKRDCTGHEVDDTYFEVTF